MRDGWTISRPGLFTLDRHEGTYVQANIVCPQCLNVCWNAFIPGNQEDHFEGRDEAMEWCEEQAKGGEA